LRELDDEVSDSNPSALGLETFKMKWKDPQIKENIVYLREDTDEEG
jgi:hypothetical protein